jgi:hypothetical protein
MKYIENTIKRSLGGIAESPLLTTLTMLISSRGHSLDVRQIRASMILARMHLIALMFATLTLLWIAIDIFAFNAVVWQPLAVFRISTSLAFIALAFYTQGINDITRARIAIALMFFIPTAFYTLAYPILSVIETSEWSRAVFIGYALLPYIIAGGLGFA